MSSKFILGGDQMKKSQMHAISYSIRKREEEKRLQELEQLGFAEVFNYQTLYKTTRGFLNADENGRKKAIKSALSAMENRLDRLIKCNAKTSDGTPHKDIDTLNGLISKFKNLIK